ncbi:MAG TPA: ATP cone domain-containing protein [Thermoleophilaceae bacterium]
MPETIVFNRDRHGLPYSKGLMAQSLSASGLSPTRSYELAQIVERRLDERTGAQIAVADLHELVEEVLLEQEGADAVRRFHEWQRLDRLDRPLVVLLAGSTGVGKSTLATMLAARLGITRVIATDVIRQVLRAFFSREFMPAVHYSAFEAGQAIELVLDPREDPDIVGFARQAESIATGVEAIIERACLERTPMVLEGIHLVPGMLRDELHDRCIAVEAVLSVSDEELHRSHFAMRGGHRPAERYLSRFEQIRKLQDYLVGEARERGVAVIENESVDRALPRLMDLVLDSVSRVSSSEPR